MGRLEGVSPAKAAEGFSEELKLERCGPAGGGKGRRSDRGTAAEDWQGRSEEGASLAHPWNPEGGAAGWGMRLDGVGVGGHLGADHMELHGAISSRA